MRGFRWQRGLTRGINEFLEIELAGMATPAIFIFDPDKVREYVDGRFSVGETSWKIRIETPAERGPLGWISIIDGPQKDYAGPIDAVTWQELGRIIRANSTPFKATA